MENLNKTEAAKDYIEAIKRSWTYARLTDEERARLFKAIQNCCDTCLKGSYQQRREQLQSIYYAFLLALDYKPIGWRENI